MCGFFQLNGLEGREAVCRELSLSPSQLNKNSPLLLELVKKGHQTHNQVRVVAHAVSLHKVSSCTKEIGRAQV